ncbi:MAG: restriction endonuclease subunit S, partial [Kiritimatiellae bacterium]|nr:restriction endonuclease subunit S [Kiritimatiellia bacterium]
MRSHLAWRKARACVSRQQVLRVQRANVSFALHLYIQSQDVGLITCNAEKLDKTFAYYLFLTRSVREQISARSQQTKIRHTSPDKISDVEVYLPDLPTQLRIAGVLGSLDEKIALNRKKIAELETLAKTIYDYWFVQFDFPDKDGKP